MDIRVVQSEIPTGSSVGWRTDSDDIRSSFGLCLIIARLVFKNKEDGPHNT
jgi:hypothetical protein